MSLKASVVVYLQSGWRLYCAFVPRSRRRWCAPSSTLTETRANAFSALKRFHWERRCANIYHAQMFFLVAKMKR